MKLSELLTGQKGIITHVRGDGAFRRRILEMGFVRGEEVESMQTAPLKDPTEYKVMGYEVSLRRSEADLIEVMPSRHCGLDPQPPEKEPNVERHSNVAQGIAGQARNDSSTAGLTRNDSSTAGLTRNDSSTAGLTRNDSSTAKTINVALVGNPNSGKTSLFNVASGTHEHVGNFSGVTVDAKAGKFRHKDYMFNLVDLPGTYSLSAYSPEEVYVCKHLDEAKPDIILNVISASNLERNLYLTTQVIDRQSPVVIALNMYDELQKSGGTFDYDRVAEMIGCPIVPTVASSGKGIHELFDKIIEVHEGKNPVARPVKINYEEDDDDPSTARYSFIRSLLLETYAPGQHDGLHVTHLIDRLLINKWWGFPLFFLFMFVMFESTFFLGQYPMKWIEAGVQALADWIGNTMAEGPLKDLLTEGIIAGVGSVIVFLPIIIILYLFISFMEDTGYMARAAFIMDKFMHKIGLHGKSFIPLLMGFGCNVPAIMGTRIIESRNVRLITMLINPLMSCSARLPVYILLIAAFFPAQGGLILFMLYLTGIALACLAALFFKRFVITEDDLPFVMELPPYRMPTAKAISRHIWREASQYLKKMGGLILVASIFIWFLQYFPRNSQPTDELTALQTEQQAENSYIGRIGRFIEPVMRPLGFDWKISASLLAGTAAKEVVISTLGILYSGEDEEDTVVLGQRLQAEKYTDGTPVFTPLVALSLLLFVLIYFPCIATVVAIKNESGSWKWALLTITYTTTLAWIVSFAVYQIGTILTVALSHQSVG
ncbi:hypothetical protein AGMMS49982_03810 [Bacteroidia bacterium]|nr:hypothetical protein AGMMS49982_03810 [Bacteroidia bacterium]